MTTDHAGNQDESLESRVKHLRAVEGLSIRQIMKALSMGKMRVTRIINGQSIQKPPKQTLLAPYERLIEEWYQEHTYLLVQQVYNRLKTYGYTGGYTMFAVHTRKYRRKSKRPVFHELTFLPAEDYGKQEIMLS